MGTVFSLPVLTSDDLDRDLARLAEQAGWDLVATVIDAEAPALSKFSRRDGPGTGTAVLLGSEGYGLDAGTVGRCHRRVRIPMHHDVDSLNVAVAAGIVLYRVMEGVG